MENIKISRAKMIGLAVAAKKYIDTVGADTDKVAVSCDSMMKDESNSKAIEDHDAKIKKAEIKLNRDIRDLSVENAVTYSEGDKKGAFILNDKGERMFTIEGQKAVNKGLDGLYDKYEQDITNLMNEEVDFYITKVSDLPGLSIEFRRSLALIIN